MIFSVSLDLHWNRLIVRRLKIIIVMYFILRLFLQRYKVADQSRV